MPPARHEEGWREAADGLRLYWQRWKPEAPRAMLLFVHGLGEHSGRYQNPIAYFVARRFACYALDCRAHGRSGGTPVHIDCFEEFVADVRTIAAWMREEHPGLPLFLVGHSQGGLIVVACALWHPLGLAGLIVSSPFLGLHPETRPGPLLHHAARILSRIHPRLRLPNNLDPRKLSRDPTVVAAYAADPLVSHQVSVRWFTEVLRIQKRVHAGAGELGLPALVMVSGADRVVDSEATRRFAARAPAHLTEFLRWDGLYHEMFNEPEKERVFRKMEEWLEGRLLSECLPPGAGRRSG
jgi:alpha-beta hydrolase superfamily lysophospholipase